MISLFNDNSRDDVLRRAHRQRTRSDNMGANAERLVKWINRRNVRRRKTQHELRSTTHRVLQQHYSPPGKINTDPSSTTMNHIPKQSLDPPIELSPNQKSMDSLLDEEDKDEESHATTITHKSNLENAKMHAEEAFHDDEPSSAPFAPREAMLQYVSLHWECLPEIGVMELCSISSSSATDRLRSPSESPPVSPIPSVALQKWADDDVTEQQLPE